MKIGNGIVLTVFFCAAFFSCATAQPLAEPAVAALPEPEPLPPPQVKGMSWTFDDPHEGTQGWYLVNTEFVEYKGRALLTRDDSAFGNGMLRLDLDFSGSKNSEWSEPRMKNIFYEPVELEGVTQFSFDFYMNPSLHRTGSLKAKVSSGKGIDVEAVCDISGTFSMNNAAEDAGRGFRKARVIIPMEHVVQGSMEEMYFSIAGSLVDYAGPVFIANVRWE